MTTPFRFPPPPPPPPKAAAAPNDAPQYASSQRGGRGDSRGGRGRGFQGRGQGRGRGNNLRGNGRGGYGNGGSRGGQHGGNGQNSERGDRPGGNGQNSGRGYQQQNYNPQSPSAPPNIPPGSHVNPLFANQLQLGQPQMDPMAFAQTMAFMAQVQATAIAQTTGYNANSNSITQAPQSPTQQQYFPQHSSPKQSRGTKRKRHNERTLNWKAEHAPKPVQNSQQSHKPQKVKAAPPPAVPSFGFALPTVQSSLATAAPRAKGRSDQSRRKVHLGLTARTEPVTESESGSDEEIDEEAAFAAEIKGMVFEHQGETISLQTPAELLAWRKDRKKHYPTQKRAEEKAREAAAQREHELEFLRRVKGHPKKSTNDGYAERAAVRKTEDVKKADEKKAEQPQKSAEQLQNEWDRGTLQRKAMLPKSDTQESVSRSTERNPLAIDLGLGYGSETESDEEIGSELEESSVVSSYEESSEDSDSDANPDADADDSDAAPEEQSSKTVTAPIVPAPEPAKQRIEAPRPKKEYTKERDCVNWKRYGKCNYGDRCKWKHTPREEEKITGLYEKLVEQEKKQTDELALEAVKFLGRNGFLG